MLGRIIKIGIFGASASTMLAVNLYPKINCESKRSFYNDDSHKQADIGKPSELQVPKLVQDEISVESYFESKIKLAREELFKYWETSKQVYIDKSHSYYQGEREVLSTVSSLHDKREELFPDALYVLTGGLLGLVVARKRNILVKIIAPIACGLVSFKLFFPITSKNVFGFIDEAEKTNLPDVYSKQTELLNKTEELMKRTSELPQEGSQEISNLLEKSKKTIGDYTGLNVDQNITEKKK